MSLGEPVARVIRRDLIRGEYLPAGTPVPVLSDLRERHETYWGRPPCCCSIMA